MTPTPAATAERLTQFHENPAVISAWQRVLAPVLRWSVPERRRTVLAAGALLVLLHKPLQSLSSSKSPAIPQETWASVLSIALMLGFTWCCHKAAQNFSAWPEILRRRPQLTMHAVFWLLLVLIWITAPYHGVARSILVGVAVLMPAVLWRCGYILLSGQRGKAKNARFRDQFMVLFPIWGGSNTPYGKGLDYLSRHEAKTEEELARSHLAGIKLFILAGLWSVLAEVMRGAVYGDAKSPVTKALSGWSLGIPHLGALIGHQDGVPLHLAWISLYAELILQVLRMAAEGHIIIGVLRMFGFNVFRNTYKPLLAETVVGFWNRYYYYFKELLSEFFFLPTFARRFKSWPRLRLFAAVFAAAFVGNMYYHVLMSETHLVEADAAALWNGYNSRLFYCLLLAAGIFLSMLREQRRAGSGVAPGPLRRVVKIAGVWTFFAIVFIWNAKGGADFSTRCEFFLSLFGLT